VETGNKIPPSLPFVKGRFLLFGKEGLGEILRRERLLSYGLLSGSSGEK
jgi:hypothetical protein